MPPAARRPPPADHTIAIPPPLRHSGPTGSRAASLSSGARRICFSATASFTASAVLAVVGGLSLRQARVAGAALRPSTGHATAAWPYAAIPLLFAAQQCIEGGLWLALPGQAPAVPGLTVAYLFFANILWPVYVPLAVLLIEPDAAYRRRLIAPLGAGIAVGGFFLYALLTQPVSAEITGHHVAYHLPHRYPVLAVLVYAAAACLAPLMSSHPMVRLFGAALVGSMVVSYLFFALWFASVWCFLAAGLSMLVLLHFRRRARPVDRGLAESVAETAAPHTKG